MQTLPFEQPPELDFEEIERAMARGRRMRSDMQYEVVSWLWRGLPSLLRRRGPEASREITCLSAGH